MEKIILAGGCFWCTEAVFKRLKGVAKVTSGYAGNRPKPPTYEEVSTGTTVFAEAVEVVFDPAVLPLPKLLEVFFSMHDPTTLNRQGADVGTQYRSAIFYYTEGQKAAVDGFLQELSVSGKFASPVVTAVEPVTYFFSAEEYHLNFYDNNPNYGYCRLVIDPKITKLYKDFRPNLKNEYQS